MHSNAIGQFVIGESAIGATPFAWEDTVFSQYANSPVLLALLESFNDNVDPTGPMDNFFDQLWNVDSAQGYGLDVWGRIVGVNRVLQAAPTKYLGFNEMGAVDIDPFGQSPLFSGHLSTSNFSLSDDAFRLLILAKAAANIWDGSIPGLNLILRLLFPGKVAYCTDGGDMTMTYTFAFALTPVELGIINNTGVLPRPAGVSATVVQI